MSEIIEVVLRTFVAFILLMLVARILGKQTLAEMTFHDFVAGITIGALAANLAFNTNLSFWSIVTSLLVFSSIALILTIIALKSRKARNWISGTPTVIIENGMILEDNMKKMKYNLDSLNQGLREKNIFDINEVEYAILETHGHLSVLKKPIYRNVNKLDLSILNLPPSRLPIELIMDGKIIKKNLSQNQIMDEWLNAELSKRNLTLPEVCYAVVGTTGQLYFDLYSDQVYSPVDKE